MKIHENSLHSFNQTAQASSSQASTSLKQKSTQSISKQGEVATLAREGQSTNLPKNLTQLENTPDGRSPAKQKNKKFSLKSLLGLKHNKPQSSPQNANKANVPQQPDNGRQRTTLGSLLSNSGSSIGSSGTTFREHGKQNESLTQALKIANTLSQDIQNTPLDFNLVNNDTENDPEVLSHLQAFQARNQKLSTIPEGVNEGFDEDSFSIKRAGKEPLTSTPSTTIETGESSKIKSSNSEPSTPSELSRNNSNVSSTSALTSNTTAETSSIKGPIISLEKEKLVFSGETALNTLLGETLGKSSQTYTAHESHQDNQNQLLLDKQGRVFQVATQPNIGLLAMHSSTPILDASAPPKSLIEHLEQSGQNSADNGYHSVATGIYSDTNDNHWRVSEGKLYALKELSDSEALSGIKLWQQEDDPVNKLTEVNDNVLGIKNKHQITNLTTNQSSLKLEQEIQSFSVNQEGQVALLLKSDDVPTLSLLPTLSSPAQDTQNLELKYAETSRQKDPVKLTEVHISSDRLFAIDNDNNVLSASLPKTGQSKVEFKALPQAELQNAFGKDVKFEGFTAHKDGTLSLLARDHSGQLHGCPANSSSGNTFKPGWNLSDILNLNNTLGLELSDSQAMKEQDFGNLGSLSIDNGTLYSKDKLTQQWSKIGDNVQNLQRGIDGQAYALQDGSLKKVTVDASSSKIGFGADNVFSLTQTHGKASLADGPKGLPEGKLNAVAVIDNYQHVSLSESGKLQYSHIRPGTSNPMHPPRDINIQGLEGNIKQLSVDRDHQLFALTDSGKLFSLAKNDWQAPQASPSTTLWKEETNDLLTKNLDGASLTLTKDHQLEITTSTNTKLTKLEGGWEKSTPATSSDSSTMRDKFFNNLAQATKGIKLSNDGIQYTMNAKLGGFIGLESNKVSSKFTDRLKAHVFKPSLEIPRPLKTAAYSAQHQWQGREGLKPLYEQESALYKALEANNTNIESNSLPKRDSMDVKTRIDRLDLGPLGDGLKAELESLRSEIEHSAEKQLIQLGKHQGVLQDNNAAELKLNYKPSVIKDAVQSLNPDRSGHNLSQEVLTSWKRNPASQDSNVSQLLKTFTEMNVNMSHRKTEIPAGRMRDSNDQMALSKARLVLDTLTLQKLDNLIDKAELLSGIAPDQTQIDTLHKNVSELRDGSYENSRIKHYTDKGMTGHKDVERHYDVAKSFIKSFSSPEHGVNLITRAVLGSTDQSELNSDLKDLMHSLKPNDSITISRGYNLGASATFIPTELGNKAVSMFPSAGVDSKRGYELEINGLDDGVEIVLKGNLAQSGSANFGMNKNFLPDLMGNNADRIPIAINKHQNFSPDVVAGAGVTLNGGAANMHELKLNLRGDTIDAFVEGLTKGNISPEELIDIGTEHTNVQGKKWNFSVDLGINVAARARVNLTDADDNPSAMIRLGGGMSANLNILSMNHDDLKYQSIDSSKHRINKTDGLFNRASAGIDGALTLGSNLNKSEGDLVMNANISSSATVAVDNSVKVRGELKSKQSSEVNIKDINNLAGKLRDAFQDPASQQVLKGLNELTDINEQLKVLKDHFLSGNTEETKPKNDLQYAALNSIKSIDIQHLAATKNVDLMSDIKGVVSHANPHQLDHSGVLNFLTSLIAPSKKNPLSEQISNFMKDDPVISNMINDIRAKPNTYTWVTLQLKDEPRLKLEKEFVEGKVTLEDAQKILADPEQRRIKSISILETGQHKEGFNSPTLFLGGGSNASIYMEREAGVINFSYGQDQNTPRNYTITGDFTEAKPELANAIQDLKESKGLTLNV